MRWWRCSAGTRRSWASRPTTRESVARRIQADVLEATQLHCSVGIGDTKVRAKIATEFGKPRGTFRLTRENWFAVMGEKPVKELWGIGNRISERLGRPRHRDGAPAGRDARRAADGGVRPQHRSAHRPARTRRQHQPRRRQPLDRPRPRPRDHLPAGPHHPGRDRGSAPRTGPAGRRGHPPRGPACMRVHLKVRFKPFFTFNRSRKLAEPTYDAELIAATALGPAGRPRGRPAHPPPRRPRRDGPSRRRLRRPAHPRPARESLRLRAPGSAAAARSAATVASRESRRSIRPPWPGMTWLMSLMPRSRLITDSHEVAEGGHHDRDQPERDTDPPVAVEQVDDEQAAGDHARERRAGEALPRLLRRDHRRHRVLAEQHAGGVPADVGGDRDRDEGDDALDALVLGQQQRHERAEERARRSG